MQKTIYTFLTILFISLSLFSCEKEEINSKTDSDKYYVKYVVESSTGYPQGLLNFVITTGNQQSKNYVIAARSPWEHIIGPVNKEFNSTIFVTKGGPSNTRYWDTILKLQVQIFVSKNGSPYVLKKSNNSVILRDSVQLDFTIDY
ncbi:hypothetical protein [Pontibacter sp. HSC-36F09]|uniref:hypothetical protein n=1 Tax=Pontibacter sp. HSC-36F09 TaxID=2910966 RepID=UPI00209EDB85|nr:hypothetical protein [Pontibacter sp. HSC-36F09]MCP2042071.1 hypothetical protein [Pontibacter sp. HSC-36F09]